MAEVITGAVCTFQTVDLSSNVKSIELSQEWDEVDVTSMTSGGYRKRKAGLSDASLTVDFYNDWAAASVNATISPRLGLTMAVTMKKSSGTVSATNPLYSFNVLVTDWKPLSASVGEAAMTSVTWPVSGVITVTTV
jgi:hypothetical protein